MDDDTLQQLLGECEIAAFEAAQYAFDVETVERTGRDASWIRAKAQYWELRLKVARMEASRLGVELGSCADDH